MDNWDIEMIKHKMILVVLIFLFMAVSTNAKADYLTTLSFSGYIQSNSVDIDVDLWSVPFVNDWNRDGKIDLLIGQKNSTNDGGYISYYQNTGTNGSPSFVGSTTILACNNTCLLNVPGSG